MLVPLFNNSETWRPTIDGDILTYVPPKERVGPIVATFAAMLLISWGTAGFLWFVGAFRFFGGAGHKPGLEGTIVLGVPVLLGYAFYGKPKGTQMPKESSRIGSLMCGFMYLVGLTAALLLHRTVQDTGVLIDQTFAVTFASIWLLAPMIFLFKPKALCVLDRHKRTAEFRGTSHSLQNITEVRIDPIVTPHLTLHQVVLSGSNAEDVKLIGSMRRDLIAVEARRIADFLGIGFEPNLNSGVTP